MSPRTEHNLSLWLLFFAFLFIFLFGVLGLFRNSHLGFDFIVFHIAGSLILEGQNPWLYSIGTTAPFSYPPHFGFVTALYALIPFQPALYLHIGVILVSLVTIAYLANIWFIGIKDIRKMTLPQGMALAILIGNPFVAHTIYEGQLVLPTAAVTLLSWHFLNRERWILAGLFLGLATLKPQISILYVVWLLLRMEFRVLALGAGVSAVMMLPLLIQWGVIDTFLNWFKSMEYYGTVLANKPGFQHVVGVESILVTLGITGFGWLVKPFALISLFALYYYRQHFSQVFTIQLFSVIALTFIYGHDADFVGLIVLWSYLLALSFNTRQLKNVMWVLLVMAIFFLPQRILRILDWPFIYQWRSFVLLLICYLVYRWERQSSGSIKPLPSIREIKFG